MELPQWVEVASRLSHRDGERMRYKLRIVGGLAVWIAVSVPVEAAPRATIDGDIDSDWSVDLVDYGSLSVCLDGPLFPIGQECQISDLDSDNDVDLYDYALFQREFTGLAVLRSLIAKDADDGVEVDDTTWLDNGIAGTDRTMMGALLRCKKRAKIFFWPTPNIVVL